MPKKLVADIGSFKWVNRLGDCLLWEDFLKMAKVFSSNLWGTFSTIEEMHYLLQKMGRVAFWGRFF
jgi:hypothetical protein